MTFAPMPIANINHVHVATRVVVNAYTAPLADPPNPAAHGGICVREFCGCGAERATNRNNGNHETSDWSWKGAQV
jgi:hypothetical protein